MQFSLLFIYFFLFTLQYLPSAIELLDDNSPRLLIIIAIGTRVFFSFSLSFNREDGTFPPFFILLKKIITIICNFLGKKKCDLKSILEITRDWNIFELHLKGQRDLWHPENDLLLLCGFYFWFDSKVNK